MSLLQRGSRVDAFRPVVERLHVDPLVAAEMHHGRTAGPKPLEPLHPLPPLHLIQSPRHVTALPSECERNQKPRSRRKSTPGYWTARSPWSWQWCALTTAIAKISASSSSRCSIHSLRSSASFAEQERPAHAAGDAVVPACDGNVDKVCAGHCHGWISFGGWPRLPRLSPSARVHALDPIGGAVVRKLSIARPWGEASPLVLGELGDRPLPLPSVRQSRQPA